MCIVPVRISYKDHEGEIITYVLLDENCQGTFVSEALVTQLSVPVRSTSITVETINGSVTEKSFADNGLVVKPAERFGDIYGNPVVELPTSYTKEVLKCYDEEVPTPSKIKDWVHL